MSNWPWEPLARDGKSFCRSISLVVVGYSNGGQPAIELADWAAANIKSNKNVNGKNIIPHVGLVVINAVNASTKTAVKNGSSNQLDWEVNYYQNPDVAVTGLQLDGSGAHLHGSNIKGIDENIRLSRDQLLRFDYAAYNPDFSKLDNADQRNPHKLIDDYVVFHKSLSTSILDKLASWTRNAVSNPK